MTDVAPQDQRKNLAIRQISHAGFEALLSTLEKHGFEDMVRNLRTMGQVENVMRKSPEMVGMLIALAWKFRDSELLADLFKTAEGTIVAAEADPIAPCGRSFEDIRRAHLLGTARLYLTQRPQTANGNAKAGDTARPGFLSRIFSLFGGSKAPDTAKLDAAALYKAVKPYLHHQRQFELIPAYGMLPLRQVGHIGALLPALSTSEAIHVYGGLASGSAKSLVKIARAFAEVVLADPGLSEEYLAATESFRVGLLDIDDSVAGYALNHLLNQYHDVVPAMVIEENNAIEIVRRLAPKVGIDLWEVFRDPQRSVNVRFCPEPVAQALGIAATQVHDAVSSSFSSAKNPVALGLILAEISKDIGETAFCSAICGVEHAKFWDGVVANLNRADALEAGVDLTLPKSSAAMHSVTAAALRDIQSEIRKAPQAKAA